jgi:EAL domain-containing protein (putative c-di-GMP-specific phosphodiesterase class I)
MPLPQSIVPLPLLDMNDLMSSRSNSIRFTAGSRIFEQNTQGDCAYMIDSGHVEISSSAGEKKRPLATLGPGEIFGEMALLDGRPRSATATALHETTVFVIPRQQLLEEINGGSPIARLLLIASVNRLRASLGESIPLNRFHPTSSDRPSEFDSRFQAARDDAAEKVRLRFELEHAITNSEFELNYQPIVSLTDGRTAGFEALARWPRHGQQRMPPAQFIPIAESTGLIVPLGAWILKSALDALRVANRQKMGADTFMSVNVSPRQLDCEENVERLVTIIQQADVDPAAVKLEITEQVLLADPRMATIGLARLTETGASISIDDFGTGYSSLNYLHRFPLGTLKIDRSFVSQIIANQARQRVVAAVLGLSRELGMEDVAEGIEEMDEFRWLQSHGCEYGQGYLFAKPQPLTEALRSLACNFEW